MAETADGDKIKKFKELVKKGYSVRRALKESGLSMRKYRASYDEIWSDPELESFKPESKGDKESSEDSPVEESERRLAEYLGSGKTELEKKWEELKAQEAAYLKAAMKIVGMAGMANAGEEDDKPRGEYDGDSFRTLEEFEASLRRFEETRAKIREALEKMGFRVEDVYMRRDDVERAIEEAKRRAQEELVDDKRIEAVQNIVQDAVSRIIELFKPAVETLFAPKQQEVGEVRKLLEGASASQQSSA